MSGCRRSQVEQLGQIVLRREMESRQAGRGSDPAAPRRHQARAGAGCTAAAGSVRSRGNEIGQGTSARRRGPRSCSRSRLADGSILGDHELIVRLLIELARQ